MSSVYNFFVVILAIVAVHVLIAIVKLIFRARRVRKARKEGTFSAEGSRPSDHKMGRKPLPHPIVRAGMFIFTLLLAIAQIVHMLLKPTSYKYWVDYLVFVFIVIIIVIQYMTWRHPNLLGRTIADLLRWFFQRQFTADHFRCGFCGYNLAGHLDSLRDENQKVICPECGKNIDEVGVTLPGFADRRSVERLKAKVYFMLSVAAAFYLCLIIVFRFWLMSSPFVALALLLFIIKCGQCYNASSSLKSR